MYTKVTPERFGKIDLLGVNAGGIVDGQSLAGINDVTEENYDLYIGLALF